MTVDDHQVLRQALVTLVLEKELKAHAELAEELGKHREKKTLVFVQCF